MNRLLLALALAATTALPLSAQITRAPIASPPHADLTGGETELQRLQQLAADNDGRISALQIAVNRAAQQFTACLGGLKYQCTAPNVSSNSQGGNQDCGPYACNSATGLCVEANTCRTSGDCSSGTSCDPDGSCHPPTQPVNN